MVLEEIGKQWDGVTDETTVSKIRSVSEQVFALQAASKKSRVFENVNASKKACAFGATVVALLEAQTVKRINIVGNALQWWRPSKRVMRRSVC